MEFTTSQELFDKIRIHALEIMENGEPEPNVLHAGLTAFISMTMFHAPCRHAVIQMIGSAMETAVSMHSGEDEEKGE